mmetsp:Transcript_22448/g.34873  ORF Transcript_22448/g.34873 Transcript_22448/m.34873 type:complete len:647 (-) Transcript_22448:19-1959(-)
MASDALLPSDPTQALVLASAEHDHALALIEDGPKRRRTITPAAKKGNRWGLLDDKPFKPLPYVDLPVGLDDDEVDQFLREQRLEDLHRKIHTQVLEDVDPDIRPPSPPPIYDKSGARLNTREIRSRKAMMAEYNRLIRYMIKTIDGYTPPAEWKPQKLVKKVLLPIERYPSAPFMGVIIGARGVNHKRLQESSGCKIFIRGKDIGDKFQSDEEVQMPQHVHIEGDTEEQIEAAEKLIAPLINPESPEFEYARTHGMQQLAVVNGYVVAKAEQRCSVCGALGHLGFDCPENNHFSYQMANVVCAICGDKGHVASDCKKAMEQHQAENIDWKDEAEKKYAMNAAYEKMMSELGVESSTAPTPVGAQPKAAAATGSPPGATTPMRPDATAQTDPYMPGTVTASGNTTAIRPLQQDLPLQPKATPRPWRPWQPQAPLQPNMRPMVKMPATTVAPWGATASTGSSYSSSAPLTRGSPDVDNTLLCPTGLTALASTVLREMSQETGARISLSNALEPGGQRVLIHGTRESRERAKLHFRAWLSVQSGTTEEDVDFSLGAGFPPQGFPPSGFPPSGFPPMGFPPSMGKGPAGIRPNNSFPPSMGSGILPPNGFPPDSSSTSLGSQVFQPPITQPNVIAPPGMPAGFGVSWDEL